jgi:hypothetical protein
VARRYVGFLAATAADPRFTAGEILGEIAKNHRLTVAERLLYRFVIVPRTRRDLREWADRQEIWDHERMASVPAAQRAQHVIRSR